MMIKSARRRSLIATFLVAQMLGWGSSLSYQWLATLQEQARFPAPGQRVDVGGYQLHLYCTGQRDSLYPTVILEGGLGAPALMWAMVQSGLESQRRVCSYDRAGYGWSDPSPLPRTAQMMTSELHQLLHKANEPPPYVLVGHSLGSVLVRVYAANYPDDVAGLVLLDPRHEAFFERMPPEYLRTDEANRQRTQWLTVLTPLGVTRLAGNTGALDTFEAYLAPLPENIEPMAWAKMIYNPQHWTTTLAEREASLASYAQVKQTVLPKDLPLRILTAEQGDSAWVASGQTINDANHILWLSLQQEQAQLSSRGEWVLVPQSRHYLYLDNPTAVSEAILTLPR